MHDHRAAGEHGSVPPALRRALPAVLVVALLIAAGSLAWPYTVDDAYIVARYATRWATGRGYTMNDGPATDGVTGPGFTALLALGVSLGLAPVFLAKVLGLSATAAAAALVVSRIRGQAAGRYPAAWALLALSAQTTLTAWCVGGLETGIAVFLVTAVTLETTRQGEPRGVIVGLALGCLAWLRPELAVFGAVQLTAVFTVSRREAGRALGLAALGAGSVIAFRLFVFGHPLPLSFFAKGGDPLHGFRYAIGGVLLCTGVGGLVLARRGAVAAGARYRFVALSLIAHVLAIAVTSGDWMPGYRLIAPIVPSYVLLAAQGIRFGQVALPRARLHLVMAALAVAVPAADLAVQIPLARNGAA
ncbi:MAG: hypothetical protein H5U40_13255, partial [Polyangiaceae bacterium]|nr:hypothetical protein [Polyangiaceae bacterium]